MTRDLGGTAHNTARLAKWQAPKASQARPASKNHRLSKLRLETVFVLHRQGTLQQVHSTRRTNPLASQDPHHPDPGKPPGGNISPLCQSSLKPTFVKSTKAIKQKGKKRVVQ